MVLQRWPYEGSSWKHMQSYHLYMDVNIFGSPYQRMIFELFHDSAPFTAENFRALCTGEKGLDPVTKKRLSYSNSYFHSVEDSSSYVKGGALDNKTGKCVKSIYGPNPKVESNSMRHDKEGLLSMSREDQENCRADFLITLKADRRLDSSHVVFGRLLEGMDTVRDIGKYCSNYTIVINRCGMLFNDAIPRDVIVRPYPSSGRA